MIVGGKSVAWQLAGMQSLLVDGSSQTHIPVHALGKAGSRMTGWSELSR